MDFDNITPQIEWLINDRGISIDAINKLQIYEDEIWAPSLKRNIPMVVFPWVRNGERYSSKARSSEKVFGAPQDAKNVSKGVYNEDALKLPGDVVITEGEIDTASVITCGHDKAISVPDGWNPGMKTDSDNNKFRLVREQLLASRRVICAGDNDENGRDLPLFLAQYLNEIVVEEHIKKRPDVRYVEYPPECKDANDVLVKFGPAVLKKLIDDAKEVVPDGSTIYDVTDKVPHEKRTFLKTGIMGLDDRIALQLGTISVVTGVPGHGKSSFGLWLAYKIQRNNVGREGLNGCKVGLFTFESDFTRVRESLFNFMNGMNMKEALKREEEHRIFQFFDNQAYTNNFYYCKRTDTGQTIYSLYWLMSEIHKYVYEYGCSIIVIDPWNELEHLLDRGETMTNYINHALQQLREMAERYNIHIMIVAHPKKMDSLSRAPNGYDIADSAAFFNKPSLGISLYRREAAENEHVGEDIDNQEEGMVDLVTWKIRNAEACKVACGKTRLLFNKNRLDYSVYPDDQVSYFKEDDEWDRKLERFLDDLMKY